MASVKVVLFTSKVLANGEHPILIRITKDRRSNYIGTGKSCLKEHWDFEKDKPNKKHPLRLELEIFLSKKKEEANKMILSFENDEKYFSGESIKKKIQRKHAKVTVFQYFDMHIKNLMDANRIGYANAFSDSKRALIKFRNGRDLLFEDVTVKFLNEYENWFSQRGISGNTISVYMRTLRTLMNKAIAEDYCNPSIYPFKKYNISKLQTKTIKRALTKDEMKRIIEIAVPKDSSLFHSKNYFIFSFYMMGMNFSDMAFLKWSNIRNERLSYERMKTGVNYNVKLLPPALDILDYYKMNYFQSATDYVFPILNEIHESPKSINYRIEKVLKQTNKDLKEIAKLAEVDFLLTTYVARHSWATILKRSGVSTSIISEGLGHTTEKTTQIYLDSFENETLDEANKSLL